MGAMSLATLLSVIFYWFGKGDITLILFSGADQYLCRKYFPFALVHVRRLC